MVTRYRDIPRFNNIYAAHTIGACNLIELLEELHRFSVGLAALDGELDRNASLEGDGELGGDIGGINWICSPTFSSGRRR